MPGKAGKVNKKAERHQTEIGEMLGKAREKLAACGGSLGAPDFVPVAAEMFDADEDNGICRGLVVLTADGRVISYSRKAGKRGDGPEDGGESIRAIEVGGIASVEMRRDFGVFAGEAVMKDGGVVAICHATPSLSAQVIPVLRKIADTVAERNRKPGEGAEYKRVHRGDRQAMGPVAICPKCGKPLKPGEKTCGKCFDKGKVFRRLLELASPHKGGIALVVIISFVLLGVNMLSPVVNRVLVDDYILNAEKTAVSLSEPLRVLIPFALTVMLMLLLRVATLGIGFLKSVISMKIGLGTVVDVRKKLFAKVQKLSVKRVDQKTTGDLMVTISSDAGQIQGFVNNWLPNFVQQIILLIVVSVVMAVYDWRLLVIALAPVPITVTAIAAFHKHTRRLMGKQREAASKTSSALHDILSGIRVVKAYGTEERENRRYSFAAGKERDVSVQTEILLAKLAPFIGFGLSVGSYFLLYYTGNMILSGTLTVGECAMFSAYVGLIYEPLNWLANFPSQMLRVLTSANRIFTLFDEQEEDDEPDGVVRRIDGNITFEDVTFGYDDTSTVLRNISLEMKPGEMIGLVGRSGVGKTTLINLVMRLYEVNSGRILIDDIDILDYDRECLRSQLGAVLQETVLVRGTLYENLIYAKPSATVSEIMECSKAAGVHDFAVRLPDGYNTLIGEKGYTLSGGERQRVAIARAILRNPRILILDEATSSLDTEMEKQIQDAIAALVKDRTTIAIAHRLSTLRNATKIVVLDAGKIAETGTHSELMKKKGLYYELVIAQRKTAKA